MKIQKAYKHMEMLHPSLVIKKKKKRISDFRSPQVWLTLRSPIVDKFVEKSKFSCTSVEEC